jgi:hypothetical protein
MMEQKNFEGLMKNVFVTILILALNVSGQTTGSAKKPGLFHTQTAWNLSEKTLEIANYSSYFRKSNIIRDPKKGDHAVLFNDFTNTLAFDYSLTRRFQIGLHQTLMQSHNQDADGAYNIPDDLILSVKYQASHPRRELYFGFALDSRLPTGKRHNVLFEPYASDRASFTFLGLASYAKDSFVPEEGLNIHLNLGYRFHADNGSTISNQDQVQLSAESSTQEFVYRAAFIFPIQPVNFTFELNGSTFISSPAQTAYVRSNYFYFTPAFNFPIHAGVTLSFGADLKLMSDMLVDYPVPDADNYAIKRVQVPSLPAWKINAGISFALADIFSAGRSHHPAESDSSIMTTGTDSTNQTKPQTGQEHLLTPQEIKAEAAKKQLEKMRQERIQRDLQLEELRKKVEQKKKENQTDPN